MFKIQARLQSARIDIASYRAELIARASSTIHEAGVTWLETATSVIPVWSGASRGTFAKLANELGVRFPISPSKTGPNRVRDGIDSSKGDVTTDTNSLRFSFTYETDLAHLVYNEQFDANSSPDPTLFSRLKQPGPYNFQELANNAAQSVIDDFVPPIPTSLISTITVSQ